MGVEGVYICVRVFECVGDGEAERGSARQQTEGGVSRKRGGMD